jgi:predicted DNA-binding antitoxin AbrB/MazE fold protein
MTHIEAVYRHGVFEPLQPVNLREEQHVQLSIEAGEGQTLQAWLAGVQAMQAAVLRRSGSLPDSAQDIAADRLR